MTLPVAHPFSAALADCKICGVSHTYTSHTYLIMFSSLGHAYKRPYSWYIPATYLYAWFARCLGSVWDTYRLSHGVSSARRTISCARGRTRSRGGRDSDRESNTLTSRPTGQQVCRYPDQHTNRASAEVCHRIHTEFDSERDELPPTRHIITTVF